MATWQSWARSRYPTIFFFGSRMDSDISFVLKTGSGAELDLNNFNEKFLVYKFLVKIL